MQASSGTSFSQAPRWRRATIAIWILACGCAAAGPAMFDPEVPELVAENEAVGDPHGGRFPFESAVAGLEGDGPLLATFETSAGAIPCRLRPDRAPITVANFVGLARGVRPFFDSDAGKWTTAPYYDGTVFHRSEAGQFVQGGQRGDDTSPGFRLQDEHSAGDAFDRPGLLAMANRETPHTGAAEFFITTKAARDMDGNYTIFGRCSEVWVLNELAAKIEGGENPQLQRVVVSREGSP